MNTSQLQQLLTHPILARHIASGSIVPTLRQVGLCLSLDPEKGRTTYGLINWDEKKIRIKAKKTKERFCPLFPELSGLLLEAIEQSNQDFCIGYHRHSDNLSTHMKRIIRRAGVEPWPKTFVNLRSTRRTELQETFPAHVLDEWFGHSERVASEHYLQVTQGHWDAGVNFEEGK